jgi:hypothetical protein
MRTAQLQQVVMSTVWAVIGTNGKYCIHGKTEMCSAVTVHREMGGATVSYRQIVNHLACRQFKQSFQ